MATNTPSSTPLKLLWQAALVVALVAIAWVLGQAIPAKNNSITQTTPEVKPAAALTGNLPKGAEVHFYSLPRIGDPTAMNEIATRLAGAQKEIIVVARQITSLPILSTLKGREAAGVPVTTLLSPDTTVGDFGHTKLFTWLHDNGINGVYRDIFTSVSHMIVIDGRTVIISDLPFSQKAYQPADVNAAQTTALGFLYIIDDEKLAGDLATQLHQRAQTQNRIL